MQKIQRMSDSLFYFILFLSDFIIGNSHKSWPIKVRDILFKITP